MTKILAPIIRVITREEDGMDPQSVNSLQMLDLNHLAQRKAMIRENAIDLHSVMAAWAGKINLRSWPKQEFTLISRLLNCSRYKRILS